MSEKNALFRCDLKPSKSAFKSTNATKYQGSARKKKLDIEGVFHTQVLTSVQKMGYARPIISICDSIRSGNKNNHSPHLNPTIPHLFVWWLLRFRFHNPSLAHQNWTQIVSQSKNGNVDINVLCIFGIIPTGWQLSVPLAYFLLPEWPEAVLQRSRIDSGKRKQCANGLHNKTTSKLGGDFRIRINICVSTLSYLTFGWISMQNRRKVCLLYFLSLFLLLLCVEWFKIKTQHMLFVFGRMILFAACSFGADIIARVEHGNVKQKQRRNANKTRLQCNCISLQLVWVESFGCLSLAKVYCKSDQHCSCRVTIC